MAFCEKCGGKLEDAMNFCTSCGHCISREGITNKNVDLPTTNSNVNQSSKIKALLFVFICLILSLVIVTVSILYSSKPTSNSQFQESRDTNLINPSINQSDTSTEEQVKPKHPGLGLTRMQIMRSFSDAFPEYLSDTLDGEERRIADSRENLAILEIVGDSDNISSTCLAFKFPSNDPIVIFYATKFVSITIPEIQNPQAWVANRLERGLRGDTVIENYSNKSVTIIYSPKMMAMSIDVKAKKP